MQSKVGSGQHEYKNSRDRDSQGLLWNEELELKKPFSRSEHSEEPVSTSTSPEDLDGDMANEEANVNTNSDESASSLDAYEEWPSESQENRSPNMGFVEPTDKEAREVQHTRDMHNKSKLEHKANRLEKIERQQAAQQEKKEKVESKPELKQKPKKAQGFFDKRQTKKPTPHHEVRNNCNY